MPAPGGVQRADRAVDNVPLGTVKTRTRTAMRKLRSSLEVHDD
jgi:DNA-directed RNA polymerase specialized sigma24 family protein